MRLFEDNIHIEIPGRPTPSTRSPEAEPSLDGKVNSASRRDAVEAFLRLRLFMPERQKRIVATCMNGEERQYFFDKMVEIAATVEGMPVTYQQDGKGDEAIAHLHYFLGDCHWYITEKDREGEVEQAFGYAILHGDLINAEYGYIPITEIVDTGVGAELDFHFKPTPMAQIKQALEDRYG